jgi:hypothetical protein
MICKSEYDCIPVLIEPWIISVAEGKISAPISPFILSVRKAHIT